MAHPEEAPCGTDYLIEQLEQVREAGRAHGDCLEGVALARWQGLERRIGALRTKILVARGRVTDALVFEVNGVTREAIELLLEAARASVTPRRGAERPS